MLYTIPDYYKEFSCIAADCEDTCCAGWQIVMMRSQAAVQRQQQDLIILKEFRPRAASLRQLAPGRLPSGYGKALCIFKPG